MIGGKHGHERIVFLAQSPVKQMRCGESDRSGGVSANWLREYVRRGDARYLLSHSGGLLGVGDDPLARRWKQRRQARDGLLEHRVGAHDVEQLLRSTRAAARPESRAAASGKNNRMRSERFV